MVPLRNYVPVPSSLLPTLGLDSLATLSLAEKLQREGLI